MVPEYACASADCVPFKNLFLVASEMCLKELVALSSSFPHFSVFSDGAYS